MTAYTLADPRAWWIAGMLVMTLVSWLFGLHEVLPFLMFLGWSVQSPRDRS